MADQVPLIYVNIPTISIDGIPVKGGILSLDDAAIADNIAYEHAIGNVLMGINLQSISKTLSCAIIIGSDMYNIIYPKLRNGQQIVSSDAFANMLIGEMIATFTTNHSGAIKTLTVRYTNVVVQREEKKGLINTQNPNEMGKLYLQFFASQAVII